MEALGSPGATRVSVAKETPNILEEQVDSLRRIFPEVFYEDKIDLEKLRIILGEVTESKPEKFAFTWTGKRSALQILQMPTRATLLPAKEESVDFEKTRNLFIEGDNLEVLKLLYKPYFGKVKMIYIDPPYNTGSDLVYVDNYADPLDAYLKMTDQVDDSGNLMTTNPETSGRYHSTWLSMMYPRFYLARQLLRDDGVIFVSIDDHEVHSLRLMMNELFGEENFVAQLIWNSKRGGGGGVKTVVSEHEYVMVYAKQNQPEALGKQLVEAEPLDMHDEKGPFRKGRELNKWGAGSARADRPTMFFPIPGPNGEDVFPIRNDGTEGRWRLGKKAMLRIVEAGDALFEKRSDGTYIVYQKIRTTEPRYKPYRTILPLEVGTSADGTASLKELFDGKCPFDFTKPPSLLKHLLSVAGVEDEDLVVDFFAGSCPLAQAVFEYCRDEGISLRTILVQLPEPTQRKTMNGKIEESIAFTMGFRNIAEVGKERIRRVIAKMKKEQASRLDQDKLVEDLSFRVFKLARSNYKLWKGVKDKTPEAYATEMETHIDSLVDGWKRENVIYEVMLKEGFGLTSKIEPEKYRDNEIWRVTDLDKGQSFLICLDDEISTSTIRHLELAKNDLFVCRDIALDDTGAANLALQCNLKTI